MILGAQLFTLRDFMRNEKDIIRSLKKVAKIGYTTIQVSGIGEIKPNRLREICDDLSLKIVLTHTNQDRIINDTDGVIEEHNILGCEHIGIGSMPGKYLTSDWYKYFAEDFKEPAQKIYKSGKMFMYHNHDFEFRKVGGITIFEHLMQDFTKEEMGFTLDTYWVQSGGADIVYWIEKLKDRLPCVHLKDMAINTKHERVMAPVMEGNINFEKVIKAFGEANTKYLLVEQDTCETSPFECLETSFVNLKKLGYN